jgi:putative glutathione S-transferase
LIVRNLKGLQDVISLSVVHWNMGPLGWRFLADGETADKVTEDPIMRAKHLREIYFKVNPQYEGRFTVPVLWDKKLGAIVNNESSEIIRMLNSEFDEWSSAPGLTYYPDALKDKIDAVNEWIYPQINNGVYRSGFATKQDAYELACREVFDGLDKVEEILSKNEFLVGDTFTEADIRLFTTIVRFQVRLLLVLRTWSNYTNTHLAPRPSTTATSNATSRPSLTTPTSSAGPAACFKCPESAKRLISTTSKDITMSLIGR